MELTLTAKVRLYPDPEQVAILQQTVDAYRQGCIWVSGIVETTHCLQQTVLHAKTYRPLRTQFGLRSQMAQSVIKTVMARYKSVLGNGQPWTHVQFTKPALDLVWNRDYSLKSSGLSLNTLAGWSTSLLPCTGWNAFLMGPGGLVRPNRRTAMAVGFSIFR